VGPRRNPSSRSWLESRFHCHSTTGLVMSSGPDHAALGFLHMLGKRPSTACMPQSSMLNILGGGSACGATATTACRACPSVLGTGGA